MTDPTCESCKVQKERASSEKVKSKAQGGNVSACEVEYKAVDACMSKNKGQINLCKEQWEAFRRCHG